MGKVARIIGNFSSRPSGTPVKAAKAKIVISPKTDRMGHQAKNQWQEKRGRSLYEMKTTQVMEIKTERNGPSGGLDEGWERAGIT
ncbi:MAG: hypothetical protein AB9866_16310 [Syntrophobacteraceae bacterium]